MVMPDLTVNLQLISLVLAIIAFTWFVFLDTCSRLSEQNTGLTHSFWLIGPVFLGFPIWAIYFITRLSINVPILIHQQWTLVFLTAILAMLIALIACLSAVTFSHKLWAQLASSLAIALLTYAIHCITLYVENPVLSFSVTGSLLSSLGLASFAIFFLLRAAAFLKHSGYIKQLFSACVATLLAAVMYTLDLPKYFLNDSGIVNIHDTPLFDNLAFGYALGLTAFTLLILLMVGLWFSRAHTLTSKPTKTLRIGLMVIAIGTVSIVTTSRWLVEHTLNQDTLSLYLLDHIEHDIAQIASDIRAKDMAPTDLPQRFQTTIANVHVLISGGTNTEGEQILPLRDMHVVSDLKILLQLINALSAAPTPLHLTVSSVINELNTLNAIIDDVLYDIRIAINNDRTMLKWTTFSTSFIIVMMFVIFSWLISRGWYAIEAKNQQLEKLVKKRTEELENVLSDLDIQMSDLASNNAKISLLNEALGELRDNDHLYDEGERNEFYTLILENIIRVIDASCVFYARYNNDGSLHSKYFYGVSALKNDVYSLVFATTPCKLQTMLANEKVSLKIDDIRSDRITKNDVQHTNKLQCFLGIPVIVSKKIKGSIGFFNKEGGSSYTDDDEILMNIFASHLAHVLERHGLIKSMAKT